MGFWLSMLAVDLLIPAVMIFLGRRFLTKPPKKINSLHGYRTDRSMRDQQSWDFAQAYCGGLWKKTGKLLLLSAAPMALTIGCDADAVAAWGAGITVAQVIVMLLTIIPVERALKRNFDKS